MLHDPPSLVLIVAEDDVLDVALRRTEFADGCALVCSAIFALFFSAAILLLVRRGSHCRHSVFVER